MLKTSLGNKKKNKYYNNQDIFIIKSVKREKYNFLYILYGKNIKNIRRTSHKN